MEHCEYCAGVVDGVDVDIMTLMSRHGKMLHTDCMVQALHAYEAFSDYIYRDGTPEQARRSWRLAESRVRVLYDRALKNLVVEEA